MLFFIILQNTLLPSWTGFNQNLASGRIPSATKIGYLPVVDANPTDKSTINTILLKSIDIADKLEIQEIVLVMDQAIYSKAQEIRWQDGNLTKRLILRLGDFHTALNFLGILGKRFRDAGLQDIMTESQILAEGSANRVMSGQQYNRSMRCHKIVAEAMQRLRFHDFLDSIPKDESVTACNTLRQLHMSYPDNFEEMANENASKILQEQYNKHVKKRSTENVNYAFWSTYLELVELLLVFMRATREGNWPLHLSAAKDMVPWFFAYDRINYSRYLPVYIHEMTALRNTHPDVHHAFCEGEFVVQRRVDKGFCGTACDQVIEQTFNRDSKTKGGMIGITQNRSAMSRWILSHAARCEITNICSQLAGKDTTLSVHPDHHRILQDESDISEVMMTVESLGSPFAASADDQLVHISSGVVAPADIQSSLMSAHEAGKTAYTTFTTERLLDGTQGFFNTISTLRPKTFSHLTVKPKSKKSMECMSLRESRNLLGRMLMIAQVRKLDLKDILTYPLSNYPPTFSNFDGSMRRTNKSVLVNVLQTKVPDAITTTPSGGVTAVIVDAMALIHQSSNIPTTFGEYADVLFTVLINIGLRHNASRLDFVVDTYPQLSIKSLERTRRSHGVSLQEIRVTRHDIKIPRPFQKFLSVGSNKESLVEFLFSEWKSYPSHRLHGIVLYICHSKYCHKIESSVDEVNVDDITELRCDHEEADTRMYLHAHHASHTDSVDTVIIRSPDTDVVILGLNFVDAISVKVKLYQHITGRNSRMLDISEIARNLGKTQVKALLGLAYILRL